MLTLNKINKAVQAKYPFVQVVKGKGYFYLWSDDDATALKICGMYDTSIGVYAVNHLTLEQWVGNVVDLIQNDRNKSFHETDNRKTR